MAEYKVFAYRGSFVGSYPRHVGDGQYMGCAQICVDRPAGQDSAKPMERVFSVGTYPTEDKAVHAAEFQAKQIIDGLGMNWAPFTEPGGLRSR